MKIAKTKKVETITEEIKIKDGTYYFSYGYKTDEPYEFYKVRIENEALTEMFTNLAVTKIKNIYADYLIFYKEDFTDYLGAVVEAYFIRDWNQGEQEIREISQEEFEKQKQLILERL